MTARKDGQPKKKREMTPELLEKLAKARELALAAKRKEKEGERGFNSTEPNFSKIAMPPQGGDPLHPRTTTKAKSTIDTQQILQRRYGVAASAAEST